MSRRLIENKACSLLSYGDNEQLFALLGMRCQTLATTVIQLYVSDPEHSQWLKQDAGILCFVKDNIRKNFFFRLYCLDRNALIWEQEIYNNMEYIRAREFFHTFEGEGCMVAFNFANDIEANHLKATVDHKLAIKKKKQERTNLRVRQEGTAKSPTNNNIIPRSPTNNNDLTMPKHRAEPGKRKTKRKPLTKADIGTPSQFKHVTHIGFDPIKGFDVNSEDPHMTEFLQKAGVSEKELEDKDTREFIYDFINKHGGKEAVKEEVQKAKTQAPVTPSPTTGPRVPQRHGSRPRGKVIAPTPPTNTAQTPGTSPTSNNSGFIPPPPPRAPGIAPPPPGVAPPPPPPLPPLQLETEVTDQVLVPATDTQSALMESIRKGTTLKPVDAETESSVETPRGDLLSEIRKGFHLKPAAEREIKPVSAPAKKGGGDLASALAQALAERRPVIQSDDDSTSDTDSNDDEWRA